MKILAKTLLLSLLLLPVAPLFAQAAFVVTLGDSLTQGDGDDGIGGGYPARLLSLLQPPYPGTTVDNLGISGDTTNDLINKQLDQAVSLLNGAPAGSARIALVWIGSNDLFGLYNSTVCEEYYPDIETCETWEMGYAYANVDNILQQLRATGAAVYVALLDDQSKRPVMTDPALRAEQMSGITAADVGRMATQIPLYNAAVANHAASRGATTVDFFNTTIFEQWATLSADGNHPNGAGYDAIAAIWLQAITGETPANGNGYGVIDAVTHDWTTTATNAPVVISDPTGAPTIGALDGTPLLIAGPPTFHGIDPGVVRVRNVSSSGFDLRFQEWDYLDGIHGRQEAVDYLLLAGGRMAFADGTTLEAGSFNLSGTASWKAVNFTQPFAKPPALFLTVQTTNAASAVMAKARGVGVGGFEAALFEQESLMDGHAGEIVSYLAIHAPNGGGILDIDGVETPYSIQRIQTDERWKPVLSQHLLLQEEQSEDQETAHPNETTDLLILGSHLFAQVVSSTDIDTGALRRLRPEFDATMEWGLIRGVTQAWRTVPLYRAARYANPIIIAQSVSQNARQPGVVRLREVGPDGFQIRFQEWDYLDGRHGKEDIFYLVADAGVQDLGGLTVEAGSLQTSALSRAGNWEDVHLSGGFANPIALAAVQSYNGTQAVTTRMRNLSAGSFDIAMDEQESLADGHGVETLGWIALEQGEGATEDGRLVQTFERQINGKFQTVGFSTTDQTPATVVSGVQTREGGDPVTLRHRNPSTNGIELRLQEEQSKDEETAHGNEWVGIFVGE